tara:strand:+ start:478 stop:849 length:372 start_codon:yes stop_codon:yes gene_type:complete
MPKKELQHAFIKKYSFPKRLEESTRIRAKFPDRVPVIVERSINTGVDIPNIKKQKYLVPFDITAGQFMFIIRKRIHLEPEHAIFMFIDNKLAQTSELFGTLYDNNKNEDGFLYLTYSGENTFG